MLNSAPYIISENQCTPDKNLPTTIKVTNTEIAVVIMNFNNLIISYILYKINYKHYILKAVIICVKLFVNSQANI